MIERVWHGWTAPENAAAYENLLKTQVFPEIAARMPEGYRGIRLLRRSLDQEVEFATIMRFESLDDVKRFAGEDYEKSYVPPEARELLERFDRRSRHYEIRVHLEY